MEICSACDRIALGGTASNSQAILMIKDIQTGNQIAFYEFNDKNLAVTNPGDYIDSVESIHIND